VGCLRCVMLARSSNSDSRCFTQYMLPHAMCVTRIYLKSSRTRYVWKVREPAALPRPFRHVRSHGQSEYTVKAFTLNAAGLYSLLQGSPFVLSHRPSRQPIGTSAAAICWRPRSVASILN
jgi:hypothetical protein